MRAFRSLQAQTFRDWEYIIVDDGSTDNSAQIIAETPDPRLKTVVRTANRGAGAALNVGVERATGRYLAFLDADDEFLPAHLEAHVALMENEPGIDMLWGGIDLIVKDEDQSWVPDVLRGYGFIHVSDCVVQGTFFVRRRVFDSVRYTEDRSVWYQDFEFFKRVESASFKCQRFPLPTYRYYRDTGGSQVDRVKASWPDRAPGEGPDPASWRASPQAAPPFPHAMPRVLGRPINS